MNNKEKIELIILKHKQNDIDTKNAVNEILLLFSVIGRSDQLIDFAIKNGYFQDIPKGQKEGLINRFEESINCR
jgi:hypothetical protein